MIIRLFRTRNLVRFKIGVYFYIFSFLISNQWMASHSLFLGNKPFHRIQNDPNQVQHLRNTNQNLFDWMNPKSYIKFRLWTRENPILGQLLKINDMDLIGTSHFNGSLRTKIIVHGFAHSANELYFEQWLVNIRDSYLEKFDLNVIIVDYTFFALPQFYWLPGPNLVSEQLAKFIQFLLKKDLVNLNELHLIGYSWGAHIVGNTGHKLQGQVGRITGLDPANPLHRYVTDDLRLDKSDAKFVDVIHTNSGGPFGEGFLGLELALAHADFYPNSGKAQPGCPKRWIYIYETIECDHIRSVTLFTESILFPEAFPACRCSSWDSYVKGSCFCDADNSTFMGEAVNLSARGSFYLFTRGDSPYGFGQSINTNLLKRQT